MHVRLVPIRCSDSTLATHAREARIVPLSTRCPNNARKAPSQSLRPLNARTVLLGTSAQTLRNPLVTARLGSAIRKKAVRSARRARRTMNAQFHIKTRVRAQKASRLHKEKASV